MMLQTNSGLGLYPADPCYQAKRPGWLPYWWDTNGEYACLTSGRTFPLIAPPPPAAPQTEAEMLAWTPDDVYTAQQARWEAWKTTNRALAETEGPPPPPSSTLAEWWEANKWFVLGGGLGLLAVMRIGK